ncbi:stalk domain-containing protein [Paenibacillus aurantius]|uniref:Stalk domain-containing protein n=1 Tax=Paenibacillus aurantius TaxID=2918900 RepID=A0AA96LIQ7_9BACL|nr:stalk domain-containing protein [Paenibacillus aurantius]WNQ14089.1 stalk domain-containing protein [Paenibacillus aurantius]
MMKGYGKRKQMAGYSLLLAGCLAFNGIAGAFGETQPEGIKIKEFSLLDTGSDVVGAADFTPEGKKDGHFKLQLHLNQKTTINAVVLRSTDDYGKDNYQGVWRTNRVTTGWLLGIVQDKTVTTGSGTTHERIIVNPGFRKDIKEPVGQFEGDLTFDLYASDNGTIKETQSYVLEIETPQGTVFSKPIKYKQPMTSGETPAPSPSPVTSPAPVPSPTPVPTPTPVPAPAQGSHDLEIRVFFKGTELHFDEMAPVLKDGRTLVPFRQLFETLGFKVDWVEEGNVRKAIGKKNGQSIELTIDSTTAMVNGKAVALDVPAQIMGGRTMVPLRFVSESSGYEVGFSSSGQVWTIHIEEAAPGTPVPVPSPSPTPAPIPSVGEVEPYVVKGFLRNAHGDPLPGVTINADNMLFSDSNLAAVTDEKGFYRIELAQLPTTWSMTTTFTKEYNGKEQRFFLRSDVDQPFAGSTGAIRHFTLKGVVGHIEIHPDFWSFDDNLPMFEMKDLEVTLTPVGLLFDGSGGETITTMADVLPTGGHGVDKIPLGRYKISAAWKPEGHAPMPMLVRVTGKGKFGPSVEFDFHNPLGAPSIFVNEIDAKLDSQSVN